MKRINPERQYYHIMYTYINLRQKIQGQSFMKKRTFIVDYLNGAHVD